MSFSEEIAFYTRQYDPFMMNALNFKYQSSRIMRKMEKKKRVVHQPDLGTSKGGLTFLFLPNSRREPGNFDCSITSARMCIISKTWSAITCLSLLWVVDGSCSKTQNPHSQQSRRFTQHLIDMTTIYKVFQACKKQTFPTFAAYHMTRR